MKANSPLGSRAAVWWQRFDRSRVGAVVCAVALFVLSLKALGSLVDHYYDYVFEPDAWMTLVTTIAYMDAIRKASLDPLPPAGPYPPYFDSQFIAYATGALAGKAFVALGWLDGKSLESENNLAVWSIRHVNLLAHAGAGVFLLLAARVLCGSNLLALILGGLMLLSPQNLAIDLLRIDHFIAFWLAVAIYGSIIVAAGRATAVTAVWLGIGIGFLVPSKITGIAFVVLPVAAYAIAMAKRQFRWRDFSIFCGCATVVAAVLSLRFLAMNWGDLTVLLEAKLASVVAWKAVTPTKPYFFFNWDAFLPNGRLFLWIVFVSAAIAAVRAVQKREGVLLWILGIAILFTLLGAVTQKHPRGGYHMVPIYLLLVAAGAGSVAAWCRQRNWRLCEMAVPAAIALLLIWPVHVAHAGYERVRTAAKHRKNAVKVTRIEPRKWFKRYVPKGARVQVILWSEWALPPVFDLSYHVSNEYFAFPFLDREASADFHPPDFETLEKNCDILLLNDNHVYWSVRGLENFGHKENARRWKEFFAEVRKRYPTVVFGTPYINYFVREVVIVVVNPDILKHPLPEDKDATVR